LTLAVGVPAFYVPSGSSAVPQCTGSAANPTAAQGTLCVYESVKGNARFSVAGPFIDPVTTVSTSNTQPFGVILRVLPSAAGDTFVYGSWAVTAP
jgi:hypothetical protein